MSNCKNCKSELTGNFCSDCGQPVNLKRIDAHYILHEIEHVLHFEKGILFTIKELIIRPGQNIREFITDNRSRLVKPILFVIVSSLIYSIISHFFHIEGGYVQLKEVKNSALVAIFDWIQNHYGYSNIIMGVFIAAWVKLFFRKYRYNFFEILILLCFVMGMGMLLFTVFAIAEGVTNISLMQISGMLFLVYCSWAIGQFFDPVRPVNYFKAAASYILGMLCFTITVTFLAVFIDLVIKR